MATPSKPQIERDGDYFHVTGWRVFKPGYHKGRLYTKSDCEAIVRNFNRLSVGDNAFLKAKGKLGHDNEQAVAQSLGLPALGRIESARLADGEVEIDVRNIPCEGIDKNGNRYDLYEAMTRDAYPDGSIELAWDVPDPDNPAKTVPGPVLEGIAFLGEERPGVAGLAQPKPKTTDRFSRDIQGRRCVVRRVRFSEVLDVNRDQLLSKLTDMGIDVTDATVAGKSDEELQALVDQLGGPAFANFNKAKFMASPKPAPSPSAQMSDDSDGDDKGDDKYTKFAAEMNQRLGAMEAAIQGMKPEVQMAAKFSKDYDAIRKDAHRKMVEDAVNEACRQGRLHASDRADQIELGLLRDNTMKFSAGDNQGMTAFGVWKKKLFARPINEGFLESIDDSGTDEAADDAFIEKAMNTSAAGRTILAASKK